VFVALGCQEFIIIVLVFAILFAVPAVLLLRRWRGGRKK
jgi:hypothetical protein